MIPACLHSNVSIAAIFFALDIPAVLLWHVQNLVTIYKPWLEVEENFPLNSKYDWKIIAEIGSCICYAILHIVYGQYWLVIGEGHILHPIWHQAQIGVT